MGGGRIVGVLSRGGDGIEWAGTEEGEPGKVK